MLRVDCIFFTSLFFPSLVEIEELNGTHSGDWSCLVQGQQGNHTRTVSIYVIAHDTKYCPMNGEEEQREETQGEKELKGALIHYHKRGMRGQERAWKLLVGI